GLGVAERRLGNLSRGVSMRVELALDENEFLIGGGRPAILRVDDHREVHPLHEVHEHRRCPAMHEERAGVARDERELNGVVRHDHAIRDVRRNARRVKVDRVWHGGFVYYRDAHRITLADAEHWARNGSTEGPTVIADAFRDLDR